MSTGSNSLFTNKSKYRLNQLFGYQDADEHRENENRLRDAFQEQHAWNDSMDDADWKINFPNWNLGAHRGTVGIDMRGIGNDETFFFGDGSGLTNLTKGGMNNLCQLMTGAIGSVNGFPVSDRHFGTYGDYNYGSPTHRHAYWPLSAIANALWSTTSLSGTYWGPTVLNTTVYDPGAPYYDASLPAFALERMGTPILRLGGTFVFHHRFHFCLFAASPGNAWSGSPFTLKFRLYDRETGTYYGTNGAGDTAGYSTGEITITPTVVDSLWTPSVWVCETHFNVSSLPEGNYFLQYGLTIPNYGTRITSNAVWSCCSTVTTNNHGGVYPSITSPGFWEMTRGRYYAIFGTANTGEKTKWYAQNHFICWTSES